MLNRFWTSLSLSMKIFIVFITLMTCTSYLVITARDAMAANLKSVSVINDDKLKLGDIFDGITRNADYVIGAAPSPGQDMVLNARTLYRIAVALDLAWRPTSSGDQITIRREATVISYNQIENKLKSRLNEKGVTGNFNLALNNGKPSIILPQEFPENVEISAFDFDNQKDVFHATLVAPSIDNPLKKIQVTGLIERMVKIPVLKNNLRHGDIIGLNDIDMIEVAQSKLQHNILMEEKDIIGMTPRRMGYAGKFILAGSLGTPVLVDRGDKVNITFREGPLVLSAKGRALQAGSKGDLIRITNLNSSRTVDAIVSGDGQVIVQ